jgi:manganese/zinc/iron transport system permease protein
MLIDIIVVAVVTAIACATVGLFLVLQGVALISDAISHTVIFGIVMIYLLFKSFNSALLMLGAVVAGLVTVVLTEFLIGTKRVHKEIAIGLVFPLFFSVGSVLVSHYTASLHLDIDMVLLGEIALVPLKRSFFFGIDCGPWTAWFMGLIMIVNFLFVFIFYRSLQLSIFDPLTATFYGYSPTMLYYSLIILSSLTIVSALEVVGSLVAVALMVVPAATALLHVCTLDQMIKWTILYTCLAAIGGSVLGYVADVSIGGLIGVMAGTLFFSRLAEVRINAL